MTTAPVPRLIRGLAVPTIISMLVTSFYVMADTYFVGKINTQSTAAVGISFSIMAIIQAFGFFCGHGSGNFISRRLGARDYRSAEKMAATGFFSAFLIGCAIALVGLLFLDPICRALGSTPTILPYAKTYLGIILLGAPFMASSLVLNNQMRFQGNAVYAMIGIIVGAVLNIGLDPLLIFVFDMGIAGAAWSTFISQVCSFTILLFMDRKGENIRIHYRHFTPTPAYLKEKMGLTPEQFIDLKALMGDKSDNIPGVTKIGEKTGIKLLLEYGSLDGIYEHIDEMKASKMKENLISDKEQAYLSKTLATIDTNAPIEIGLDDIIYTGPHLENLAKV